MPEHSASAEDVSADDRHRLSMTILMTPDMSNLEGNVHGGTLLKYLDQVAYTCATRYARNYAVTLSVDQVVFREPIHVGELVDGDRGAGDDAGPGASGRPAHQQLLVHDVAVGADGCAVPVPPWRPRTPGERRRHTAAVRRRELRHDIARVTKEIRSSAVSADDGPN